MADHLLRTLAPISSTAWSQIDDEAKSRMMPDLAARRVVDWSGPHGRDHSATNLGRSTSVNSGPSAAPKVIASQRRVLPICEFRVEFSIDRAELAGVDRGAEDVDCGDLDRAAREAANVENCAVFHGWPDAGIVGISEASAHAPLVLGEDAAAYPHIVARAVDALRCAGIGGPYILVISPAGYTRIVETTEHGGYLLVDHLKRILDGDVLWTPGIEGGVVLTQRGGDFLLDIGQDMSVGYRDHDASRVHLYLEQSFNLRVAEPEAALGLTGP